eukprot:2514891-Pleurochrysis_carterae.AAC.1
MEGESRSRWRRKEAGGSQRCRQSSRCVRPLRERERERDVRAVLSICRAGRDHARASRRDHAGRSRARGRSRAHARAR